MDDDDDYYEYYESNEDGFSSYHPTTIDPSPWALVVTLVFCFTLILLLPLGVAIQQCLYKKRRKKKKKFQQQQEQKETRSQASPQTSNNDTTITNNNEVGTASAMASDQAPTTNAFDTVMPTTTQCDFFATSSKAPFFFMDENDDYDDDDDDDDDDDSLYGLGKEDSEACNTNDDHDVWEDDPPIVLPARPAGYKRAKGLAHLIKRAVGTNHSKSSNTGKSSKEEEETQSTNYVSMSDTTAPTQNLSHGATIFESPPAPPITAHLPTPLVNDHHEEEHDEDLLSFSYSDSEEEGGAPTDLFTQLVGEFETLNGCDDGDGRQEEQEMVKVQLSGSTVESDPLHNAEGNAPAMDLEGASGSLLVPQPTTTTTTAAFETTTPVDRSKTVPTTNKYHIALCCGRRPWYSYFCSTGFLRKLWKCASWDEEMKKIVGLALPYTLHAAVTHLFELVEIAVIGQLVAGTNATLLGAYFAIDFVLSLSTMLLDGAINSLTVLCSHAVGARNFELAGKYVQLALLLHQVIFVPIMLVCWNRIDKIVLWLGFEQEEATEAQAYGRFAFLSVAVQAFDTALHHMLDVTGFEWYSSILDMTHALASLVGVFAVGFFIEDTPLWTVGVVHLALSIVFCFLNGSMVIYKQWLLGFWDGFRSVALRDGRAVRTFLKTAGPLSLGYVVEYCEWEVLFVFAAAQGPAEVAVWGLLGMIWEFAEHIGEAIADASEVRVANLLGSQRPAVARYSSHKSLLLGVMTSLCMASMILGLRHHLPAWLTTDETLQGMLSDLLPLVCVGLAALTFGSMSWTILCAQGRMRLATAMTFLGSVLITLPLSVVSTFLLNLNLQGLLASIVIGYGLSGIVNSFIMVTSKWERISEKVAKRNTHNNDRRGGKQTSKMQTKPTIDVEYKESLEVELGQVKALISTPETLNTTGDTSDDESGSSSYDEYDWEELPEGVQEAAKLLGYSKRKWDHSIPTMYDDYDWKDLTPEQQQAAMILGYNEALWDEWDNSKA